MPHSASITATRADLRALIDPWAARYSPDREFRRRLVERTILVLTDDPSLLDGPSVDRAIFRVVHHLAISELNLAAPRARRPYLSPKGMQATNVFPKSSSRKEHSRMPHQTAAIGLRFPAEPVLPLLFNLRPDPIADFTEKIHFRRRPGAWRGVLNS